jgi:uncharacterized protein YndB with AHSA1/START domain
MNQATAEKSFVAKKSIAINAPISKVWEALINPKYIKDYLFGTEAKSDWKKGSPITFRGEWEGKSYEDKGTITDIEKEKFIRYTYWSSMSGKEDIPENYANVSYELKPVGTATELTIIHDGNESEKSRDHSESNWGHVLDNLKKLLEPNN